MIIDLQQGMLHYTLEENDPADNAMIHAAIDRTLGLYPHQITPNFMNSPAMMALIGIDPRVRIDGIQKILDAQKINLILNAHTVMGQKSTTGDKGKFWQRVMPILFEIICFRLWAALARNVNGFCPDAFLGRLAIDFKCKHREVPPHSGWKRYQATVQSYQRDHRADYYCFGQTGKSLRDGWIIGVMSKPDFTSLKYTKRKGERDDNGEVYTEDTDCIHVDQVPRWIYGEWRSFLSWRYTPKKLAILGV